GRGAPADPDDLPARGAAGPLVASASQGALEIAGVRIARPRILGEAARDDLAHRCGHARIERVNWPGFGVNDRLERLDSRFPPEGVPARQHFVEDGADCELIR